MERTSERASERSYTPVAVVAVILLLILPLLYVLATGPLVGLESRGLITIGEDSLIAKIYWPLITACETCPPLDSAMSAYFDLWTVNSPRAPAQVNAPLPTPPVLPPPVATPTPAAID